MSIGSASNRSFGGFGASRGHRPVIRVQQRYEWLYVYTFVQPQIGASPWLRLADRVNVEVFRIAL
jgi:hypothetical protein